MVVMSSWSGGYVEWIEKNIAYISVVFSWQLEKAYQRAVWLKQMGYCVKAGGPAVSMNPDILADIAEIGGAVNALPYHNPDATFTTRGCINKCAFCAVPKIEGDLVELDDWEVKPIICDNNITAASISHFDRVIDRLLEDNVSGVDFNQGLDARLLTEHHVERLVELHRAKLLKTTRLAWDHINLENEFMRAHTMLRDGGIPKNKISVYVLIGFNDTPEDALYRLQKVYDLGAYPCPMRYQPLDAAKKNDYVDEHWTEALLKKYVRYWFRKRYFGHIPFEKFINHK